MRDSLPYSARAMPDGLHTSKRRETLLRLSIGELVTWQLVASCSGCRADRVLFVRELVERFGETPTLVMLVPRLRCRVETCRRPPMRVTLRNRYPAALGGPGFVEVALVSNVTTS